jgi:hypothetical protein
VLRNNKFFFAVLIALLIIVVLCAIAFGTVPVTLSDMHSEINNLLAGHKPGNVREAVFVQTTITKSHTLFDHRGYSCRKWCTDAGIIS